MDKVYASLPLTEDLRERIRKINKKTAVVDLLSILMYDDDIEFPRRKQMFRELVINKDPVKAEQLAVRSCTSSAWKVKPSDHEADSLADALIQCVTLSIGGRNIKSHHAVGFQIQHDTYSFGQQGEDDLMKKARQMRDLWISLGSKMPQDVELD